MWPCPGCATENADRARTCEVCGAARPGRAPAGDKPAPDWRCTWLTRGHRCQLPGSIGTSSPRCTWHSFAGDQPHLAGNLEEFDRWVATLRTGRTCSPWTHYPVAVLWDWLHGESYPTDPTACWSPRCPHADPVADPRVDGQPAQAVKAILDRLNRTTTP
jgi:hypothetical protein